MSVRHRLLFAMGVPDPSRFQSLRSSPNASDDFPFYYCLTEDDRVVSSISVQPDIVFTPQGEQYRWGWSGGLLTVPEKRGRGYASRLMAEMIQVLNGEGIIRGSVSSAPSTLHIYRKLGGTVMFSAKRFLLFKSARPVLQELLENRAAARILDIPYRLLAALWLRARSAAGRYRSGKGVPERLSPSGLERLPPRHHGTRLHFDDSPSKLRWKLANSTDDKEVVLLRDEGSRAPVSYLVLQEKRVDGLYGGRLTDFNLMRLMDFAFLAPPTRTSYRQMVDFTLSEFARSDADLLEVVTADPAFERALRRAGFLAVGKGMSFSFTPPTGVDLGSGESLDDWHITHFAGDTYSF